MACIKPQYSKKQDIMLPCGKCLFCLGEKRDSWTTRVSLEYQKCFSCYFITLTYDEKYLPRIDGEPTLSMGHLSSFIKRLKIKNDREIAKQVDKDFKGLEAPKMKKVIYFGVGEYGDKLQRPHYHLIIFNLFGNTLKFLNELWTYGSIDLKIGKPGAIHYATGYVLKNQNNIEKKKREKAFLLASQKMGQWYTEANKKYHKENLTAKMNINGFTVGMPRVFRDLIFTKNEKELLREENLLRKIQEEYDWIIEKEKNGVDWNLYQSDQIDSLYQNKLNKSKKRAYENF